MEKTKEIKLHTILSSTKIVQFFVPHTTLVHIKFGLFCCNIRKEKLRHWEVGLLHLVESWGFLPGKFFFIQCFHDCVEEPITLAADPTLLAAESTPRVPSIPSCVLATAASRTLMFVLAMHGRRHTNH